MKYSVLNNMDKGIAVFFLGNQGQNLLQKSTEINGTNRWTSD